MAKGEKGQYDTAAQHSLAQTNCSPKPQPHPRPSQGSQEVQYLPPAHKEWWLETFGTVRPPLGDMAGRKSESEMDLKCVRFGRYAERNEALSELF